MRPRSPGALFPQWLKTYGLQDIEAGYSAANGWAVYAYAPERDCYGEWRGATLEEAMAAAEAGLKAGLPKINAEVT